ncbi:P-loop containing nucleoside triphosphate hydrolase protein [Lactarius vividus]|nr:P-loop containing nucleoside triphosphate hydrolase protein [Lactarius vividus]
MAIGSSSTSPACSQQVPESVGTACADSRHGAHPDMPIVLRRPDSLSPPDVIIVQSASTAIDTISTSSSSPSGTSSATKKMFQKRKSGPEERTLHHPSGALHKRSRHASPREATLLADRLRPRILDEFVGQTHLTGPNTLLFSGDGELATENVIFWGPPGCGKTTLARILSGFTDATFKEVSAAISTVNDVCAIFEEARDELQSTGRRTIVFLDEIHRFSRSHQDAFIPFIERGFVQIIGATTENPSFELNRALLHLCRVHVLERLTDADVVKIVERAVVWAAPPAADDDSDTSSAQLRPPSSPKGAPSTSSPQAEPPDLTTQPVDTSGSLPPSPVYPQLTPRVKAAIASLSSGDARTALSLLELVLLAPRTTPESALLDTLRRSVSTSYDRTGDAHYDRISALHKSVRGSQPDAALYWLARMLEAGEDPVYIARRMAVCASEDIGMADRRALPLAGLPSPHSYAMAALQACQMVGMPGCRAQLAELVAYLAEAPKSTRAYQAYNRAEKLAKRDPTLLVPVAMRDMLVGVADVLGCGEGYKYPPEYMHPVTNEYLPRQLHGEVILRREGDLGDKLWDEAALRTWEEVENGGREWVGRPQSRPHSPNDTTRSTSEGISGPYVTRAPAAAVHGGDLDELII